jgi:peptidoglycan/LPS O-acetylase OafA/YrhL
MRRGKMMVWRWPVLIGVLSLAGLLLALMGDGIWDWMSALLLAVPAALCILYSFDWRGQARKTPVGKDSRKRRS